MIRPLRIDVRVAALAVAALACLFAIRCGGGNSSNASPTGPTVPGPTTPPVNPPPSGPEILVGAGDIAWCDQANHDPDTALLLDGIGGTVFTAGDDAYFSGAASEFQNCYNASWGRHRGRTRPAPGNHEYGSAGAAPYFSYFGSNAGPSGLGYYSFDLGGWHIISMNSNVQADAGSAQAAWLRADLAQNAATKCTAAIWHHPLYSSGQNGNQGVMHDVYKILYDANADLVLTGHDHVYERFAPQDADGRFDNARGIREFVVGTGGVPLYNFNPPQPNSEVRIRNWGVIKLTLTSTQYQWDFIPVSGQGDSGVTLCH